MELHLDRLDPPDLPEAGIGAGIELSEITDGVREVREVGAATRGISLVPTMYVHMYASRVVTKYAINFTTSTPSSPLEQTLNIPRLWIQINIIKSRPRSQPRHSAHVPDQRINKARPSRQPHIPNRQREPSRYPLLIRIITELKRSLGHTNR